MGKPNLNFLFRDLTQLGLPKSQFSLVGDETAYNYNPDRYNFYMQMLDDVSDPNQKIASKVFGVLARTRRQHDRIREKIDHIADAINYLKTTYTKPPEIGAPREYGELAVLKDDLNANLKRQPIVSRYYEFDTDFTKIPTTETVKKQVAEKAREAMMGGDGEEPETGAEVPQAGVPEAVAPEAGTGAVAPEAGTEAVAPEAGTGAVAPEAVAPEAETGTVAPEAGTGAVAPEAGTEAVAPEAGSETPEQAGGSWFSDKMKDFKTIDEKKIKTAREKEEAEDDIILEYKNNPLYSPDNQEVTYTDRLVFIGMTFLFRAIALFMIDWGINTKIIRGFQTGFLYYFVIYTLLFLIWVLLVNIRKNNLFFGMLFYYINANYNKAVWKRTIIHIVIQLSILPVPLIVTDTSMTSNSEDDTFDKRERMLNTLNLFTFIIWILTSAIALRA